MKKLKFTIRPVTRKDKEALVDFRHKLDMFEYDNNPYPPKPTKAEAEKLISKYLRSRKHFLFVAEVDGKPVGFAAALIKSFNTTIKKSKGVLDSIWIEPAFRRQGIAKALSKVRLKKLKEYKLSQIVVYIRPKNDASIANIEHLGGKHTLNIYTFDTKK